MKPTKEEILNNLPQFTGTDGYHKYMGNILLTDGAKYMAEACGAFWFLDIIWSVQGKNALKREEMQVCKLQRVGEGAVVTIEDGNKNVLYTQKVGFTDFPLDEVEVWANVQDNFRVILLPSEY